MRSTYIYKQKRAPGGGGGGAAGRIKGGTGATGRAGQASRRGQSIREQRARRRLAASPPPAVGAGGNLHIWGSGAGDGTLQCASPVGASSMQWCRAGQRGKGVAGACGSGGSDDTSRRAAPAVGASPLQQRGAGGGRRASTRWRLKGRQVCSPLLWVCCNPGSRPLAGRACLKLTPSTAACRA